MASQFDESDFIDRDFQTAQKAGYASLGTTLKAAPLNRPPTREELELKVSDTHVRLAELKRAQEELERQRTELEEAKRRRIEYQTGRSELVQHLTRGVGLLEEGEFAARRDAEQMSKTLIDLRDALSKVQGLQEEAWNQENWNTELTRALTTLENARMEWNSARLKWPVLSGAAPLKDEKTSGVSKNPGAFFPQAGFLESCKIGLALTWPVALVGAGIILILLFRR